MFEPRRWHLEAGVPIAAGVLWLWFAASFGVVGFFFSMIPGCLLLASGVGCLLWPGDLRIPQFTALGGIVGVPLAIPSFWVAGPAIGTSLVLLSAASFLAAGWYSLHQEPPVESVPSPRRSLNVAAQVALDEALLATLQVSLPLPATGDHLRIPREVEAARELFEDAGWLEKPADYHQRPPALEDPEIRSAEFRGLRYEHLRFESGYAPHPDEPGRERWLAHAPNRTGHAWVLRHADPSSPWLVCLHGYQMGWPSIDLPAFRVRRLHHKLGLNVALGVLPLHGERKVGRRSGDGFISGDVLDMVHAEAHAMWDLRRLLSWIRGQGATRIGVHGLSLGGYNTALLASLDDDLACAIPGIPATDFARLVWRHAPPLQIRHAEHRGLVHDAAAEVLRVVSPLALEPKVAHERRYLFGGVADRLVPPEQIRDLWLHWGKPRTVWYQGAHLTFRMDPAVNALFKDALREGGLVAQA